ncbi:mitogen-activated protein kinase kinase kinase 14 [Rhinophrynus dorsalis]
MAIDCYEGPDQASHQALDYPIKMFKPKVAKDTIEAKIQDTINNQKVQWAKLMSKGTATEEKAGSAMGISIIAHPECENNQEICPSAQQCQVYIPDSKQYRIPDQFVNLPNNVVNATEGKPANDKKTRTARGKGKKTKKKKKGVKDGSRTPAQRGQRTPEQESLAPIPVQDEESQLDAVCSSGLWRTEGKDEVFCYNPQHCRTSNEHLQTQSHLLKDEGTKDLYKLISPIQYIYHVGASKLLPSMPPKDPSSPTSQLPNIFKALGLDFSFDCGKTLSPEWGSSKLSGPFVDSKIHSVEECVFAAQRGSVSMGEPRNLCTFAKAWHTEAEDTEGDNADNEGILLTENLKQVDYEYREGIHWNKNGAALGSGSFGDVFPAKDEKTGFSFAAKKIHVTRFRSQELTACLQVSSPSFVSVYGAIREGHWITVFMKLMKGGSLGQLIKRSGYLPEDCSLYYLGQVLNGLTYLHAEDIVHGDIKADNVLLSEDGNSVYLCDFGHSDHLPPGGSKKLLLTANYVPGTETHIAPEIVQGVPCDTRVDVWSSCCMLLHMLNGWHPWSRTHKPPLCLKIATEPPPLQEIPPSCNPLTREIIVAGLEKDPTRRLKAAQLKEKVDLALHQLGGVRSPWKMEYKEPRIFPTSPSTPEGGCEVIHPISKLAPYKPRDMPEQISDEVPGDLPFSLEDKTTEHGSLYDLEVLQLERDLFLASCLEKQEQMLSCLSEETLEHHRSYKDSMQNTLDTGSSGIHSWDSQIDPLSLNSGTFISGGVTTTPSYFNGVKVQLQTLSGEKLHILESGKTKLGDLAVGISSQIPLQSFTLLTPEGMSLPWNSEISDCGMQLQCSLAPDGGGGWTWRVMRGKLEQGPTGEVYTGGGGSS